MNSPSPLPVATRFSIRVEQTSGYEFRVRFDKEQFAEIHMDEPPPLGHDTAPNAARVLAAAIGNCLSASLVFCMSKAKVPIEGISADVNVEIVRTETRRLRIGKIDVTLYTNFFADHPVLSGCLATFEDFCIVTESVRHGIPVTVQVLAPAESAPTTCATS